MKTQEIGIVTLDYNEDGVATEATFNPTMKVNLDIKALLQLTAIPADKSPQHVEDNAGFVLASWFERLNEIELADRDHYRVAPKVIKCDNYPNGRIKHCEIAFNFQEV